MEGERAVADALASGFKPLHVLVRDQWIPTSAHLADQLVRLPSETVNAVEPALFAALAATVTPSGILAIFAFPEVSTGTGVPLVTVADGLRDPGNLGSLMRSAAAAGSTGLILAGTTVDPFNPKVVRAAMGAHFRLFVQRIEDQGVPALVASIPNRVLAEGGDHPAPEAFDWTGPSLLIVGNEAVGATAATKGIATGQVSIPLLNAVESLNAGVAAAVILFEAARQRRNLRNTAEPGSLGRSTY